MVKEIILTVCILTLIFCVIAIAKNINTFNCHDKIGKAIKKYKIVCIQNHDWEALHFVEYKDMEYYMKTLCRLWDWGYTRILPKDKFEIIKPYIVRDRKTQKPLVGVDNKLVIIDCIFKDTVRYLSAIQSGRAESLRRIDGVRPLHERDKKYAQTDSYTLIFHKKYGRSF